MDAGLAAVLGALAGAVATTGAAFATGWSTREQAKITARAEHRRQRRDARQAVYEEFMEATDAMIYAIPIAVGPDPKPLSEVTAMRDIASARHIAIRSLRTKIQLAGPTSVANAASKVTTTALFFTLSLRESAKSLEPSSTEGDPQECWKLVKQNQKKLMTEWANFTEIARNALDDDGSNT
ncbi:hypothetical protein [Streptomyces fungicidicus]